MYAHQPYKPKIPRRSTSEKDGHLENPPRGKLNETLKDGQELPYCDGIHVDCWGFNVQYQWSS